MRLRITRQPAGSIDGIYLGDFQEGFVYEVGTQLGSYLLAERLAEPVDENVPTRCPPLRGRVRFGLVPSPEKDKAAPRVPPAWAEAADRGRRKRR